MHVYIHIYIHTCIYMYTYIHTHIYRCMYVCMYACMHACMHACICICIYSIYVYMYIPERQAFIINCSRTAGLATQFDGHTISNKTIEFKVYFARVPQQRQTTTAPMIPILGATVIEVLATHVRWPARGCAHGFVH